MRDRVIGALARGTVSLRGAQGDEAISQAAKITTRLLRYARNNALLTFSDSFSGKRKGGDVIFRK